MATISTVLRLIDNVSRPLRDVNNSLNQTGKGFESFAGRIVTVNSAIQLISASSRMLMRAVGAVGQYVGAYQLQIENETKLTTVMRQRMNATQEEIDSIKELAKLEQQRGIYGDEMILQGAQELATYVNDKKALEQLIPAMGHLLAQQRGMSAGFQDMQSVATMMGKVIGGQIGGLQRIGYIFSEDEKQMLKYGTEAERAATLAKIITDNVSEMNYALAGTDAGAINNVKNAVADFREEVGKILQPIMTTFSRIKSEIINNFRDPMLKAIQAIVDYIPTLIQQILNIATVIVPVATGWAIAWAIMNYPVILTIGAIAMLVSFVANLGIISGHTGEIIGGIFGGLKATIYNLYVIVYNVFANIHDLIAGFVEFFVNVWKHPAQAMKDVFYTIFDFILGIVETVGNVIDSVFGTKIGKNINEQRAKYKELLRDNDTEKDMFRVERFQHKDVKNIIDEVKSGAKTGAELENFIRSKIADIAKNTGKSAEAVNGSGNLDVEEQNELRIDDDYKSLLAEQAVRQYQLSYATITPDFSIQNVNVSNEADVDSIFERIADKVAELAETFIKKG